MQIYPVVSGPNPSTAAHPAGRFLGRRHGTTTVFDGAIDPIAAPAAAIYPLIADFHEWTRWSPWEGLDADLNLSYSGPDGEVGASYAWKGNRKAGQENMMATELVSRRRGRSI